MCADVGLLSSSTEYCEGRLNKGSLYALLNREGEGLFSDESFTDIFSDVGRCSVPPRVVATVMVLQRAEGLTVVGQDIEGNAEDGFTIIRGVAKDRVISTVDPEARHGHKTKSRSFDGYKGHISIDADSEIIVATDVSAGNVGDGEAATALLEEALDQAESASEDEPVEVYGDASYGTADIVETLESAGIEANVKVQEAASQKGFFAKKEFDINLEDNTVRCPGGHLVVIRELADGSGR